MKKHKGVEYLKIGEVAELVDRSPLTIKNWYEWYDQQSDEYKVNNPFPEVRQDLDARHTRYYRADQVHLLIEFRDNLEYGDIAELSREKWGERGEKIKRRLKKEGTDG